jgi:hypothetical protein
MFGTILVSMTGMALPVLAGMWLTPRSERSPFAAAIQIRAQGRRSQALLSRQTRRYLGSISAAYHQGHRHGGVAASSTTRFG